MSISEEFKQRMDQKPDQYTLAWWREQFAEVTKGYRGATHAINRAMAEYADNCNAIRELKQKNTFLERELESERAKIGELQQDRETDRKAAGELKERVDRMAEFLNTLKTKVKP